MIFPRDASCFHAVHVACLMVFAASAGAQTAAPPGPEIPPPEWPELTHTRKITKRPEWIQHAFRPAYAHFEFNPKVTAVEWCAQAKAAGANCLLGVGEVPAGTIGGRIRGYPYANYNNNPDFRFPQNYALDYAWTKEFTDAAHAQGLKIALYDAAWRSVDPLLVEHREWRQLDAKGKPYERGFGSWHSPYRQAYIERWVKIARLSGMDGLVLDMFFTGPEGGDYSSYTVNAFKTKFGVEPPRRADSRDKVWQKWIEFQTWTREEVALELTEALHAVNSECAVILNQVGGWVFAETDRVFLSSRAAECVDAFLEEEGWDTKHSWNRPWAWPLAHNFQNLRLRSVTRPGIGIMWHRAFNLGEVGLEAVSYTMLANGTVPAMVVGGNWPEMSKVWQHTKACEPWIEKTGLVPWLAIHFSEKTLQWYANGGLPGCHEAYLKNVFGLFGAALELHLPIEIITDDDLADPSKLQRYATVILPNSACMSNAQARSIEQYVKAGGGLVATFETGCYDEYGTRRKEPLLTGLFGATQGEAVGRNAWAMPIHAVNHAVLQHRDIQNSGDWLHAASKPAEEALLHVGPRTRLVSAVSIHDLAAEVIAIPLVRVVNKSTVELAGADGGAPESDRNSDGATLKTLLLRQVGRGHVAFFPFDIGHAYFVYNHRINRRLIGQTVNWSAGRPNPLETSANMSVQTVLYEKGDFRIVHLLNDVSSFGRSAAPNPEAYTAFRDEVVPVFDIRVAVQGRFREAELLPAGRKLTVTALGDRTEVTVPHVDIHAMVVFKP